VDVEFVEKLITDLHVMCSYPLKEDIKAASDSCQRLADSAVIRPDGAAMYRCKTHRGLVEGEKVGKVVETVLHRIYT